MIKPTAASNQREIALAIKNGAPIYNNNMVLVGNVLYTIRNGAVKFWRMPSQKQNKRKLGINPQETINKDLGCKQIIGPPKRGAKGWKKDYILFLQKKGMLKQSA